MPKIAIMTDSNCGIMPDDAQKYHIHILPMPVLVGEDTFYEGCNITSEEFYRKLSSGEPVTTSQPSPADVLKKAGVELGKTYPRPIVDHAEAREKALDAFRETKGEDHE